MIEGSKYNSFIFNYYTDPIVALLYAITVL